MNIPPSEAMNLSLWQYEAILVNWNRLHSPDGDLDPFTEEDWLATQQFFAENPQYLH